MKAAAGRVSLLVDRHVSIDYDANAAVAQPVTDHIERHAGLREQRGVRVAQIVQGDSRDSCTPHEIPRRSAKVPWRHGRTVRPRENEIEILVRSAKTKPLFSLLGLCERRIVIAPRLTWLTSNCDTVNAQRSNNWHVT
ncbi:MAG: hypothetical protein M3Z07_03300 [Candidatus Eremiobacteraeota bacterium]|nr:hypothetical protein [Candidatus Eremiobacteraeota bacterium]